MNITIEPIGKDDISDVLTLMREFAVYEKLEDFMEVTAERLATAMFGNDAFVEGLIARNEGVAVAYALYYPHFASFRGQRGFYLEDIYINEHHRGSGLGRSMLKRMARIAADRGFERIDFLVLDWNKTAVEFYTRMGAARDDDERHFKFTGDAFRGLIEGS